MLLVVQTGESVNQAEVFRAHAVPQGLCENLINALELVANQQEDGDGPFQSIVTNLCEWSRKGLTEGLRNFVKVDNHRALEVGHLMERSFKIRRPKAEEGCPEVLVRESPEELTLRAEEVGTQKSCINVDHTAKERWGPPLVDADWHAFCQTIYKGIKGEDWEELYDCYKEMSRAARVKSHDAQKAKSIWKMKAAKDSGEDFYDPDRKDNILGEIKHDWNFGKSTSKIRSWHQIKL